MFTFFVLLAPNMARIKSSWHKNDSTLHFIVNQSWKFSGDFSIGIVGLWSLSFFSWTARDAAKNRLTIKISLVFLQMWKLKLSIAVQSLDFNDDLMLVVNCHRGHHHQRVTIEFSMRIRAVIVPNIYFHILQFSVVMKISRWMFTPHKPAFLKLVSRKKNFLWSKSSELNVMKKEKTI